MNALLRKTASLALFAAIPLQAGCTSLRYVTQAAAGQDDLNVRARDIDELVQERRVSPRMRELLSDVAQMKRYGERHGLRATTNYTKYVRVDRPAVVWVVSASDPLRFHSRSWSFPLVGSFTYLGWFDRRAADAFAAELRTEQLDVDVRGSAAYSTEGYFEDPVVSTMIAPGPEALGVLANTILHESAHATFFVRNQSTLNESVANFVGDTLGAEYVVDTKGEASPEARAYLASEREYDHRRKALRAAFVSLEELYASPRSDEDKLAAKREIVESLRAALHMTRPINNATLIQYRTYNSGQEQLRELLEVCRGDWPRFVATLKRLETTPFARPQESDVGRVVLPLIAAGCGG